MRRWLIPALGLLAALRLEAAGNSDASPTPPSSTTPSVMVSADAPLVPTPHKDYDIPDSEGAITIRPVPEDDEPEPPFLVHVDYLRRHHDVAGAIGYLQSVVNNSILSSRDQARAILELADCLQAQQRDAETLCWLKIWLQMFPNRSEIGAVAFRVGTLYTRMGLPNLARDAYYQALASAINQGQVQSNEDLTHYTRLTVATLWALASNEYQAGQWTRAIELLDRYRREASTAPPISLENAAFLQADCWYQLRQNDKAQAAYEQALQQHPFNPLAPEARLRLYHLDLLDHSPEKAEGELQALIWTVRTICPKDEAHWQQRTAETLLALHHGDHAILTPLLRKSTQLTTQGKAWQKELDHYDRLVDFQTLTQSKMADSSLSQVKNLTGFPEQADLLAMEHSIAQLAPPTPASPTP